MALSRWGEHMTIKSTIHDRLLGGNVIPVRFRGRRVREPWGVESMKQTGAGQEQGSSLPSCGSAGLACESQEVEDRDQEPFHRGGPVVAASCASVGSCVVDHLVVVGVVGRAPTGLTRGVEDIQLWSRSGRSRDPPSRRSPLCLRRCLCLLPPHLQA